MAKKKYKLLSRDSKEFISAADEFRKKILADKKELKRLQHYGRADILDDASYAAKGHSETPDREEVDNEM